MTALCQKLADASCHLICTEDMSLLSYKWIDMKQLPSTQHLLDPGKVSGFVAGVPLPAPDNVDWQHNSTLR